MTYIRTDSTRIADEAIGKPCARSILGTLRRRNTCLKSRMHTRRAPRAQDAHEAIRPTDIARRPEKIKASLSRDQFRLYKLIYERFVSSQMTPAVYDTLGRGY